MAFEGLSSRLQEITRKIEMMAKHLDIEFIDHIIIGDHCYYSFKSNQIYQSKEDWFFHFNSL